MPARDDIIAVDWTATPAAIVTSIAHASDLHTTPCGQGEMQWRRWGRPREGQSPVVLLHGGSGSWTHWIRAVPELCRRAEVWAVDLPGLGDSAMPDPPLTPDNSGAIVAAGLRNLLPADARPHLVGFSFGAHVGTFAAAELGDRLASFTIIGCAALGLPHNYLDLDKERSSMGVAERDAVHRANLAKLMIADPRRIDDLAVHVHGENLRRARFKSRAFARTAEIPETLPRVEAPLKAMWGACDVLATPSVEARYDILRRTHAELRTRTIADAGHWVAYEQPLPFSAALCELLGIAG